MHAKQERNTHLRASSETSARSIFHARLPFTNMHRSRKLRSFSGDVHLPADIELTCPGAHGRSHSVRCAASSEVCQRSGSHLQGTTPLFVPPTSFA